jgi:hypothetical protein
MYNADAVVYMIRMRMRQDADAVKDLMRMRVRVRSDTVAVVFTTDEQ